MSHLQNRNSTKKVIKVCHSLKHRSTDPKVLGLGLAHAMLLDEFSQRDLIP